ncbi:MAG: zinc-binding dehydrogenase [Chloroflexi bacterium]|nr:zinc-binding dehydrogenase [Chloroflexota bacterium]MCI0581259.1 zinc-binding dehydrogenase [Chloroflexota bacterium]MCI0644255.1 zinc-binding dehydrogenase [Chloroflexota bacterium]MCI0727574.1 zinc-binding dehydrogenase [Chloroflexota bacterium]
MKQVWITRPGPPEVLQLEDAPEPTPRTGEVRLRVEASGVCFADVLGRMGLDPYAPKTPYVPGYEVAGVVDMVGQGVPDLKEGDRTLALTQFRGYSDVVCVPHKQVFKRLEWMTAEHGAAIPISYFSAYLSLVVMGSLRKGDKVLIHNVAGGVGLAALDICKIVGAEMYGTASPNKHDFLLERGLHHPIDYRNHDYERAVMDLTGGRGVQLVLDSLGGVHWRKNYRLLMPTGRLVCLGIKSLAPNRRRSFLDQFRFVTSVPSYTPPQLRRANKAIIGVNLATLWEEADLVRSWARQIITWYDEALFRPHVDRTFKLARAAEAHHYLQDHQNVGKVLLIP